MMAQKDGMDGDGDHHGTMAMGTTMIQRLYHFTI
uniref:Uncharacterized protein n=1 Tax=Arundo donax TaxID=35708 RepID=A0A0A9EWW4_ARUDO